MQNIFVKPRLIDSAPASLPDPQTGVPLAAAGEWKPRTAFWLRRVAQGDVIACEAPAAESIASSAPKAAAKPASPSAVKSAAAPAPSVKS